MLISHGQQQVIDGGNVHRKSYQVPHEQILEVKEIVTKWGKQIPSSDDFESSTSAVFAFRTSDPALTQIDTLLKQFHAAVSANFKRVYAQQMLLACNFWLRKVNQTSGNTLPLDYVNTGTVPTDGKLSGREGRRAGITALSIVLEKWLVEQGQSHSVDSIVDSMTRPNRGVRADHHFVDVTAWNQRHATRIPEDLRTAPQRNLFVGQDPDTRLFSLDDDNQKRLAKLVFRNGKAYRWSTYTDDSGFQLFHTGGGVHYVMDKRGRIYAGTFTTGYFWHSSLAGFADALSAGFITANQGVITRIKNDSGHYHPRVQEMVTMLLRLQLYGVNLAGVSVVRDAASHGLGAATFTAAEVLAAEPGKWPDE